jgi:hypothetical protein
MSRNPSTEAVLAELRKQIDHCERQMVVHAEQESFHRERRVVFAADLERLRALADAVQGLGGRGPKEASMPASPVEIGRFFYPSGRLRLARVVSSLVEERSPEDVFGRTEIARELVSRLDLEGAARPDDRAVSLALQRLAAQGRLQVVRPGRYRREALYRRL